MPENTFAHDVPLVAVLRGEYVGSLHRGSVAVASADGKLRASLGNPLEAVFLRSAAKPFQVMPAVLSGGIEHFDLTTRELAVLCSSHSGEPRHREAVLSVLRKIGLDESTLHCGVHPPISETAARDMWRSGGDPSPVCNNCSGAHASMLLAARAMGWTIESYGDIRHPLQQMTLEILSGFAEIDTDRIEFAVDNCAVPTFRLPLLNAATAFARLATGEALETRLKHAAARVREAMMKYPEMIAGEDRFDTELMRAADGTLLCKGGAEAFQGMGSLTKGLGIALKISDGNARAVPPAATKILSDLALVDDTMRARLAAYIRPKQQTWGGEMVGSLETVFSLGESF
ncbi:MAG TPA: asparaginase [Chloroflexota bacterium]